MRKWNALLTAAILLLFLLHGILGAFQLFGVGPGALKGVAWAAAVLTGVHALIGLKLTLDSLRVWRKSGAGYFRENRLFWARRLSGFALLVFLVLHMHSFGYQVQGAYRLRPFGGPQLAEQLLLVLCLGVHILTNLRPLRISLGGRRLGAFLGDALLVLSVLLLVMALAFAVYYRRWNLW